MLSRLCAAGEEEGVEGEGEGGEMNEWRGQEEEEEGWMESDRANAASNMTVSGKRRPTERMREHDRAKCSCLEHDSIVPGESRSA